VQEIRRWSQGSGAGSTTCIHTKPSMCPLIDLGSSSVAILTLSDSFRGQQMPVEPSGSVTAAERKENNLNDLHLEMAKTGSEFRTCLAGGEACLLIRKHDHFTPTREIRRHVRALARNHPEGWKLQGHVSPATTNYLIYRIAYLFLSCSTAERARRVE